MGTPPPVPIRGNRLSASSAFSVLPFIRAHIDRPFSELSAPWPEIYSNVIPGLTSTRVRAAAIVMPYVTRSYSASVIPADDTPRQKKHASHPDNSLSIPEKSMKSPCAISRSFSSVCPLRLLTTDTTCSTFGSSRNSRSPPARPSPSRQRSRFSCQHHFRKWNYTAYRGVVYAV